MIDLHAATNRLGLAALIAGGLDLVAAPARADTLEELMDACTQVLTEGNYTGVSPFGVKRMEENRWGSIRKIDGKKVTLQIQIDWQDDTIHSCSVIGYTFGDKATIRAPGLNWANAELRANAWMDRAAQQPKQVELAIMTGAERMIAACPGPGEGFMLSIGPANFGSDASGMDEVDWPFIFEASQVADKAQACGFVAAAGKD